MMRGKTEPDFFIILIDILIVQDFSIQYKATACEFFCNETFVSDFEVVLQRHRRRHLSRSNQVLNNSPDEPACKTVTLMREAAEQDRQLTRCQNKPATKKLSIVRIVDSLLKSDNVDILDNNGILRAIAELVFTSSRQHTALTSY
ncbi:hypothetical protein Aperf_G00000096099 [Anoplocephala perfoliata]